MQRKEDQAAVLRSQAQKIITDFLIKHGLPRAEAQRQARANVQDAPLHQIERLLRDHHRKLDPAYVAEHCYYCQAKHGHFITCPTVNRASAERYCREQRKRFEFTEADAIAAHGMGV